MSLEARITARIEEFERNLSLAERRVDTMAQRVNRSGQQMGASFKGAFSGAIVGTFAAAAIKHISDIKDRAIELSDVVKGVAPAFERLGDPTLLSSLVQSTGGAVSNLELMRQAVRAQNFEIPVQNLGKFFEFASIRARETGESVDFLVNSIISGIGRKSPLILDNLGISAVRLRKELKGVGVETADVGAIAEAVEGIIDQEMTKAGISIKDVVSPIE